MFAAAVPTTNPRTDLDGEDAASADHEAIAAAVMPLRAPEAFGGDDGDGSIVGRV